MSKLAVNYRSIFPYPTNLCNRNKNYAVNRPICPQLPAVQNNIIRTRRQLTYSLQFCPYTNFNKINNDGSKVSEVFTPEQVITCAPNSASYFAVTWNARNHLIPGSYDTPPIRAACLLRKYGKDVLLHLSCDQLTKSYLNYLLRLLLERGIYTLFCIRGARYNPDRSEFKNVPELIQYIKNRFGSYYNIGIQGRLDTDFGSEALCNLQAKITSGADFIVTQAFNEFRDYRRFVHVCRCSGITAPIIPALYLFDMPVEYEEFQTKYPYLVSKPLQENPFKLDMKTNRYLWKKLARDMQHPHSNIKHVHFYTINNDFDPARKFVLKEKISLC